MRNSIHLIALLLVAGPLLAEPAQAQVPDSSTVWGDTKAYFTGPLHWDSRDWLLAGSAAALIGISHSFDGTVRRHFATGSRAVMDGKDPHSLRDAVPAAAIVAGTFAYAWWIDDERGAGETFSMLEAAGLSAVSTEVLKFAAGRKRPNETANANDWRNSGSSFPSLHSSAAFAIGTVFAESGSDDYRWIRRFIGYGMAGATAYVRMKDNVHWLSDTIAGAAIGIATARFVLNRRGSSSSAGQWSVSPGDRGGLMLSYNVPLR